MPSVSIRELRHTRQLKAWLQSGQTVELLEGDHVIARIIPEKTPGASTVWPDFAARARQRFGDQTFPGADVLADDRERY